MWWNVIVLKGTGWWVLGVPTNTETGGNGWTATILRLAQNVVQAVWNACDSTLECVGENENTHTSVTNMFNEGEGGNFDMLVDFLLENNCNTLVDFLLKGYKDWFHSPYEIRWHKKGESMKSILTEDAKRIFPLFLDDLRLRCFSLNEPIPPKIMRILGRMQVEYDEEDMESTERRYLKEEKLRLQVNPIVQQGKIDYIALRNSQVMSSQCIEQYDVIGFHLFLLWMNPDFSIVQAMHSGDFRGIEAFFTDSFSKIEKIVGLVTKFNKDLKSPLEAPGNLISKLQDHVQICETINKLGLIHAGNFEERRISFKLGKVIQKNIDTLLDITQLLISQEISDKNESSKEEGPNIDLLCKTLDNIAGKVQRNFARGKKVISGSTIEEIEATGQVILDELQAGFDRQERAGFWWNPKGEENARIILLGETTVVKLIMIDLISALPAHASSKLPWEKPALTDNLIYIYNYSTKRENLTLEGVINDFIQNGAGVTENDFPIETIYNLVSFADTIPEQSLMELTEFFLKNDTKMKSHSFEEYVIKTIAQIIRRFHLSDDSRTLSPLIEDIYNSLEKKNISHSVLNYSKVYLALAVYYIGSGDTAHIELAKECFIHYKSLSAHLKDDNKNPKNAQDETYFYVTACRNMLWIAPLSSEMLSQLDPLSRDILKMGGVNLMEQVIENHRTSAISGIENVLSDMITSMTSAWVPNQTNDSFQEKIANMIAKTIFYNICTIEIVSNYYLNTPKKREYETREISLTWGFSIVFTYPLASEDLFNRIFSQHSALIKQRIGNLIAIYNQKMEDERKNGELEVTNAQLEVSAFYDPETWLFNKNKLKEDLKEAEKNGQSQTILLVEVPDYQSIINTAGGSKKWNERMKWAQNELERANNSQWESLTGTIYKQNDSSFAIVFKCQSGTPENFTNLLEGGSFLFYMGAAIRETEDVLAKTNIALSKAIRDRKHGDRTLKIFSPEDQNSLDTLNQNTEILRQALDRNNEMVRLVPYYQPMCDENGNAVKYEALARIEKKEKDGSITVIFPWCFIDIAEEIGQSADITKTMLPQVSEDIMGDDALDVSVNMDAQSWNNREAMEMFEDMHKRGFSRRLTVEILETVALNRKDDMMQVEHLKSLGLAIAVDDYGTWQSGPERVADIGGEFIKIDMKTVKRLEDEETRAKGIKLINNAVALAEDLGMKTVAEWIETQEVFDILKGCGVDLFQWYYFSKPLPLRELQGIRVFPRG